MATPKRNALTVKKTLSHSAGGVQCMWKLLERYGGEAMRTNRTDDADYGTNPRSKLNTAQPEGEGT